ncbi:trypsin-like peptidase domain-containing protein [Xanthomarina sp. F1114]|uniref:S1C family serine protease n=1 Tax=Xanthomarina sp. F1114 TaxID=2996019 RepID=UPI00225E42B9|nr:trypsin-like peptidase domain-containing protein [Xanthomarina sp. F1114]MCX7548095.1 trypsin-like peptidase domain-containing protein [Xanthomarina sp. F1114]
MKHVYLLLFTFSSLFVHAQDLSEIYKEVSPAVVIIITSEKDIVTSEESKASFVEKEGLGSGFMISDRLILTAAHVVTVPEKISVLFPDGDIIPASVVSSYKSADIALIKLFRPRINPVTVKLGDSDALEIGEQIFIIGAPYGQGASLSAGYVSGIRKQFEGKNPFVNREFIQTDAAINQGNSGGPMFNLKGEVVGVVSSIATRSGGFDGIGYASTSNLAAKLLLNDKMPWLGADMHTLSTKECELLNVPQANALLVQRVVDSSIFGEMGIKGGDTEAMIANQKLILGGDIILGFNDITIDLSDSNLNKLAEFANSMGDNPQFTVTVYRDGKILTLKYK